MSYLLSPHVEIDEANKAISVNHHGCILETTNFMKEDHQQQDACQTDAQSLAVSQSISTSNLDSSELNLPSPYIEIDGAEMAIQENNPGFSLGTIGMVYQAVYRILTLGRSFSSWTVYIARSNTPSDRATYRPGFYHIRSRLSTSSGCSKHSWNIYRGRSQERMWFN